jgi:transcriptional regulator with XRE-family HTH domain
MGGVYVSVVGVSRAESVRNPRGHWVFGVFRLDKEWTLGARQARRRQTIFVGGKIRSLRKERNLTQAELAQRIGVQQSDLCRMENGEYKVSLDALFKILGVFGMEIGEFFRDHRSAATPDEQDRELIRMFRGLAEGERTEVLEFVRFKYVRSTSEHSS